MRATLSLSILLCISMASAQNLNDKDGLTKKAYQLSQEALKRKEWAKAKILLMNAFNRQPENIIYLSGLYELNRQHDNEDPQATAELIELMERAQYLIAPQHLPIVQQYIDQLNAKGEQQQNAATKTQSLGKKIAELSQLKLTSDSSAYQEISESLQQLNDFLSYHRETLTEKQKDRLHDKHNRLSTYRRLIDLAKELKRYVSLLEKTAHLESSRANARKLMIINTLNIMYSEDLEALPNVVKELIETEVTFAEKVLKTVRQTIAKQHYSASVKVYNNFIEHYNKAVKSNRDFQKVIMDGTSVVESMRRLQMKMQDSTVQNKATQLIGQAQTYIRHAVEAQRILYNRWAAQHCLTARNLLDNEVSLSDDDAISIFGQSALAQIDARQISPEISSIYHQLVQEILAELPAKKAIELQRQLMTADKRRLDTF